jgi:hypothetical protein
MCCSARVPCGRARGRRAGNLTELRPAPDRIPRPAGALLSRPHHLDLRRGTPCSRRAWRARQAADSLSASPCSAEVDGVEEPPRARCRAAPVSATSVEGAHRGSRPPRSEPAGGSDQGARRAQAGETGGPFLTLGAASRRGRLEEVSTLSQATSRSDGGHRVQLAQLSLEGSTGPTAGSRSRRRRERPRRSCSSDRSNSLYRNSALEGAPGSAQGRWRAFRKGLEIDPGHGPRRPTSPSLLAAGLYAALNCANPPPSWVPAACRPAQAPAGEAASPRAGRAK